VAALDVKPFNAEAGAGAKLSSSWPLMLRGATRRLPFVASSSTLTSHSLTCFASFHTSLKESVQSESSTLDESYRRLLEDINFSLKLQRRHSPLPGNAEIEDAGGSESDLIDGISVDAQVGASEPVKNNQWKRKSAEARFGSDRIGQVKLPFELVTSMQLLIDSTSCFSRLVSILKVPKRRTNTNYDLTPSVYSQFRVHGEPNGLATRQSTTR